MEDRKDPEKLLKELQEEEKEKNRGHLKIFFGYAAGVGKTYAMLEAAHAAKGKGIDVVAGYIEPHQRPETAQLVSGLEVIPSLETEHHGMKLKEFDLDAAMTRHPQLILVDELAHTNASGSRHAKRYQDIEELLKAGIDVYTTINVQHIESLKDVVGAITKVFVRERIPDSVFDNADKVEFVDIEPQELIDRLKSGKVYKERQARRAVDNFFTLENLTALREIALRRCADHVNKLTETARIKSHSDYHTDEHILVCLSSSPSNEKTIRTAARMANAFKGSFTALFVETPAFDSMSETDRKRLQSNIRLAQQLDAKIETVYGDDIPMQIAEFARLSGVSKIVLGRSAIRKQGFFHKPSLTDKLIANAPNMDIHIIPDGVSSTDVYREKKADNKKRKTVFSTEDMIKSAGVIIAASLIGWIFDYFGVNEANIILIYVLGVLIISVITYSRFYSVLSAVMSVLVFNFIFTYPKYTFHAYGNGYPVTFIIMFLTALITGSLAARLKNSARQSAYAAFRTKILFDTNQMLQQADGEQQILDTIAGQLVKLLDKNLVIYPSVNGCLGEGLIFTKECDEDREEEEYNTTREELLSVNEKAVAAWVLKNNKHAGATTQTLSNAKGLYLAIRINEKVFGVVGIGMDGQPLSAFENSILLSILGECALALESEKNAREAEEAAILAKNEQLRANLLRAISHDLRTPLTSISGNASNLLSNGRYLDENTIHQIYTDIYNDSMWLINLVENLLSVTRLEQGQLNLNISENLVEEVITEALSHVNRMQVHHKIVVKHEDEFLLAKMDAKLIVQVIINIVDNAIKYTPEDSVITITTKRKGSKAVISIADDGPGISDEVKSHIFDMFYSGANKIGDSRRSLGLGLALCKSIISAHAGTIKVKDGNPKGAVFVFTLPVGEVTLHE